MANNIGSPFELFTDTAGVPLEDGYLYIGTAGLDPVTNPVAVYWDDGLTIAAAQPVRTLNGFPSRGGTASRLYCGTDYSLTVKDKRGVIVFSTLTNPVSSAAAINGTPIGNVTPSTGAFTTLSYSTSLTGANGSSLGWVTLTGGSAAQAINGFYRPSANTISAATNSVERVQVSSAGVWSFKIINDAGAFNSVNFTDGTSNLRISLSVANGFGIGPTTATALTFYANGAQLAQFGAAGGLTVRAPTDTTVPSLVVQGAAATEEKTVTFSATAMVVNAALSNVFFTEFTANVTTAPSVTNPSDGQTINWFIKQDGTGSRTMTWPASFKWPSGVAGVLSTAANAVDLVVATYRDATGFWYASIIKDIR